MIGIYKITNQKGRVYIGQSIDIDRRFTQYKSTKCKGQVRLYNSFIKYGVESHLFEVITECVESDLNELERYYQEIYSCLNKVGLNCQYVKTETQKYKHSQETKDKIGKAHKGRVHRVGFKLTEEHKRKIGLANKGRKRPDISKLFSELNKKNKGIKNNFYGKKHTKETKKILSEKNKGKRMGFDSVVSKIILDVSNGIFYNYRELAELNNVKILNSSKIKSTNLKSKYINFIEV